MPLPAPQPESTLWQELSSNGHYGQDVCRSSPGLLFILVDQSRHASAVCTDIAATVNACLEQLTYSRETSDNVVGGLDIALLGYRSDAYGRAIVRPAWIGPLAGLELVSIGDMNAHPARIEESMQLVPDEEPGEFLECPQRMPVWIDPVATGEAPLCAALAEACRIVDNWIPKFPNSFPPIVWNITSGIFSDGSPWPYADALKRRGTQDGRVLLFNTYLRSGGTWSPFVFPDKATPMPDEAAKALYAMASVVPRPLHWDYGQTLSESARCLAYNCDGHYSRLFRGAFDWDKTPFLR